MLYRAVTRLGTAQSYMGRTGLSTAAAAAPAEYVRPTLSNVNDLLMSGQLKSFDSIPGPKGLPLIGNLLKYVWTGGLSLEKGFQRQDQIMREYTEKYGPIFREKLGEIDIVYVGHPEHIEDITRMEGVMPKRTGVDAWVAYRTERNMGLGLVTSNDLGWRKQRSVISKRLLRPKAVAAFVPKIHQTSNDLVSVLKEIRERDGNGITIPNLGNHFHKYTIESIGNILYNECLGFMKADIDMETTLFIEAIEMMFSTTMPLLLWGVERQKEKQTKLWLNHMNSWDVMMDFTSKYTKRKLAELKQQMESGADFTLDDSEFFNYLIANENMSEKDMIVNISELFIGGTDTTRNALLWTCYNLAKFPEIQQQVYQQIFSVIGADGEPTDANMRQMTLLDGVVKETLRLYPIAPGFSRMFDHDAAVGGYHIPKGAQLNANFWMMNRNPAFYKDPLEFRPQRFVRELGGESAKSGFLHVPFGAGSRMCIGRRIAELEIKMGVIKMLRNFELKLNKEVKGILKIILVPAEDIDIEFKDRVHSK